MSTEQQINYGLNHYKMGAYQQAIPSLVAAADHLEKDTPKDPRLVDVLIALGEMAQSEKRKDLASDFYQRAFKTAEELKPQDSTKLRNALVPFGLFNLQDHPSDAIHLLQRAELISRSYEDQVLNVIDQDNLALAYNANKEFERANATSLHALEVLKNIKSGKLINRTKAVILHNLAYNQMDMGRYAESESNFKESLAVMRSAPNEIEAWRLRRVKSSYALLLRKLGRESEAVAIETN
ncbi:tetratricopeptide repeat protein [Undibacterium cyanobacteriorum]|uniref:Tetratricopeptide repeat protein n=1 Tax=Undibacterium cyanobacteriorum TaxID=3073561 RepID=A0ABY9RLZ6_9BURK|nr:tetratricopeptide repeat protein [Undibacterium sp. 20NA77.5]WMW81844.1 tetratricopeptide repeat protein [Undibacterium sp. 20NA77.5]